MDNLDNICYYLDLEEINKITFIKKLSDKLVVKASHLILGILIFASLMIILDLKS